MKNLYLLILAISMGTVVFSQKANNVTDNAEKKIAISNYYLENYGAAIKGLSKAYMLDSSDADIAYLLGNSYVNLEQYKAAIPFYKKAVQLDASKSAWAYELGLLFYNMDDFKNAALYFNRAVTEGYLKNNELNENLGYAYMYSGQLEKGEKLLLGIFTQKPGNRGILRDMAQTFYDQKMYDKSLEYCQKLLRLNAKDARSLYQSGLCLQKKGNGSKGQEMCSKALKIDPLVAVLFQKDNLSGF